MADFSYYFKIYSILEAFPAPFPAYFRYQKKCKTMSINSYEILEINISYKKKTFSCEKPYHCQYWANASYNPYLHHQININLCIPHQQMGNF